MRCTITLAKQMRYWIFVVLLSVSLFGCEQTTNDVPETAVAPALIQVSPSTPTPSSEPSLRAPHRGADRLP